MRRISRAELTDADKADLMAQAGKAQQMAGHHPDAEDLDRLRRLLDGEISPADARREVQDSLRVLIDMDARHP